MTIKKVDVLMTLHSQYGVLHHFTRKIFEAFVRAGVKTRLLEGEDMLRVPAQDPPDFTVGFNGAPRNPEKQLFCDLIEVPHLALLVDPPYRFLYLTPSPHTIIACDDRVCCRLLDTIDFKRNLFVPHAVEPELISEPERERIYDLVILATFSNYKQRKTKWKTKFPPDICKMMDEAAEITFSDPKISFITAFCTTFEKKKKQPLTTFADPMITDVLQDLEVYIKGRDRVLLAESCQDMPLHIFGGTIDDMDWKTYLGKKHKNIQCHGPVDYFQALVIMKQTKVLLNPSLKNKEGGHERIFTGLACGCAVVTNNSKYLDETFDKDQGLIYYRHSHLKEMNSSINNYLGNEETRSQHVAQGRQIVLHNHTWDQRVKMILQQKDIKDLKR